MSKSKFDWSQEIAAITSDEFKPSVPFSQFVFEARGVATFLRNKLKADKKTGRPGLNEAGSEMNLELADEIDALADAVVGARSLHTRTVDPKADPSKIERAEEIVNELHAVLEYHLDDGTEDEHDARFANVVNAHKDTPDSGADYAIALREYADLAEMYVDEIAGKGGFDPKLITEAKKLSNELLAGPIPQPSPEGAIALTKRNRLMQLLDRRVRLVRAAAKFVFRKHPDIARMTSSTYERTRRVIAKRIATRKKNTTKPAEPITPVA